MIVRLLDILKSSLQNQDAMAEFDYKLSTYRPDFLWTAQEMAELWRYIAEFIVEDKEVFFKTTVNRKLNVIISKNIEDTPHKI